MRLTTSSDGVLLLVISPSRYTKLSTCLCATLSMDSHTIWSGFEKHCVSEALVWSPSLLPSHLILFTISGRSLLDSASVAISSTKRRLLLMKTELTYRRWSAPSVALAIPISSRMLKSIGNSTQPWSVPISVRNRSVKSPSTRTVLNVAW